MKKTWIIIPALALPLMMNAQDTIPVNKKIKANTEQKAGFDYFLEIDDVRGESPDTLPPAPGHLSISAGGTLSQTRTTNFIERYSAKQKAGFIFSVGYTLEFKSGRLQINAGYHKGGVRVATGDINGDGKENVTDVDLNYLSIPVQYQFYPDRNRRIFIGGGGYASLLVSSKQKGDRVYENGFTKMDAGITGSAGIWLGRRMLLQSGYNIGFIDIDLSSARKSRNGMAFIMISYSLTPKIKYGPIIKIKPKGG